MNMKHTPGPWFIWQELAMKRNDYDDDEIEYELLEMPDHCIYAGDPIECTRGKLKGHAAHICDVEAVNLDIDDDDELSRATALANARLIAAAPDLLEALKKAVDIINGEFPEPFQEGLAAIAKATGKEVL